MRNIFDVLNQIKEVAGEEYKTEIEKTENSLRFKAPEDLWNYCYDRLITQFIPPKTDTDYKVLAIWTTKSVEELKKVGEKNDI